ncbi:MAG TPA: alginate lyase family protein [Chthoniobacterales bacterium]
MNLKHLPALRRNLGSRWLAGRAFYAIKLRSGALRRRLPARSWDDESLVDALSDPALADAKRYFNYRRTAGPLFFFAASQREAYAPLLRKWDEDGRNPIALADAVGRGVIRYFEHTDAGSSFPPDWHRNPFTGEQAPSNRHWSEIDDFGCGDIKVIWEPSRFGFAFALVRAYWRTGDERYPEVFWQLVESWREANQPQQGVNWKCGQEASFRAMAWCFGLYGFWESPATTPGRLQKLAEMLWVTASRIEANIDYALSQANNHGISEAAGLWTIGLLFPEFSRAEEWCERGRTLLESEGRRLIYDDGSFSQHSVNYHRLMLHDYLWALRLGEVHGRKFSEELEDRIAQAGRFLFQIQDEGTGAVPYYGQNDGALILPLNNCSYDDFRPVIGATYYMANGERVFAEGPWSEDLLWLYGPDSLKAPLHHEERGDLRAEDGGYYTLRSPDGFIFTRCTAFRHRPSQADMLHVDLWWRGQNIAVDAGTYSYNANEAWGDSFSGTAVHNTVGVDSVDQMSRAGRFLWLPWLNGRLRCFERCGTLGYLEGAHDGYSRLTSPVTHRRGIARLGEDRWLVLDALWCHGEHSYRMHWLLADLPYEFEEDRQQITLKTEKGLYHARVGTTCGPAAISLMRGDPQTGRGWRAPYYGHREPALSLALEQRSKRTTFWTLFSPEPCRVGVAERALEITCESAAFEIELSEEPEGPLVKRIQAGDETLAVTA